MLDCETKIRGCGGRAPLDVALLFVWRCFGGLKGHCASPGSPPAILGDGDMQKLRLSRPEVQLVSCARGRFCRLFLRGKSLRE